jgi:prefoldin subunit 5
MMAVQQDFPFIDQDKLREYVPRLEALENEMDELRQRLAALRKAYEVHLPMRAVTTAIKRLRAMRQLEEHATEPLARQHLVALEAMVERCMLVPTGNGWEVPDMAGGGAACVS